MSSKFWTNASKRLLKTASYRLFAASVIKRSKSTRNTHGGRNSDIRTAVKSLCANFPGEYWREQDRNRRYPKEFVDAMTRAKFLSVLIPEQYGGGGLGVEAASAILEEIHHSGCNGAACHAQMYTMGTILRHGSEQQKKKWLPAIAAGTLRLQAFGVTEPAAGSDTISIATTARREGNYYVINGTKLWTSRAEHSDLMLLVARTAPAQENPPRDRTKTLSVFVVDLVEGIACGAITVHPIRTMVNHSTTQLFMDNLKVPVENLIGEEGLGFRYLLDGLNVERILIASECIGDARWFVEKASQYAASRKVFGRPIGQNQGVQFPIAQSYIATEAAAAIVEKAAHAYDHGEPRPAVGRLANMAKFLASEASWQAADMCLQTHGGFGFAEDYDVERKFRETRLYKVAPVSNNLVLSYIAEHVLELPKSY